MSGEIFKLDASKWPRFELYIPKCDRCGEKHYPLLYGVCNNCIYKLIQADKARADRTQEE